MTAREDLFTPVHKGLRAMIYDLSTRLQKNDFTNISATRDLITHLENDFAIARSAGCVLCVLAHHAEDEESVIFPSVAKADSQLVQSLITDHHDLTRRELALAKSAHELLEIPEPAGRVAAGAALNRRANELFAAYIYHMNREDEVVVPLMQQHFTDAQLAAMRGTIIAGLPPDRLFAILGFMLPALNVHELSDLIAAVTPTAPPAMTAAVVDLCSKKVDPSIWTEVRARTGV